MLQRCHYLSLFFAYSLIASSIFAVDEEKAIISEPQSAARYGYASPKDRSHKETDCRQKCCSKKLLICSIIAAKAALDVGLFVAALEQMPVIDDFRDSLADISCPAGDTACLNNVQELMSSGNGAYWGSAVAIGFTGIAALNDLLSIGGLISIDDLKERRAPIKLAFCGAMAGAVAFPIMLVNIASLWGNSLNDTTNIPTYALEKLSEVIKSGILVFVLSGTTFISSLILTGVAAGETQR